MSGVRRAAPLGMAPIISGDRPGHPVATALVVLLLVLLAVAPFVFPGTRSLAAASRICIFVVLAASYDILLGYTGIVSFAHTMFFALRRLWRGDPAGARLGGMGRHPGRHRSPAWRWRWWSRPASALLSVARAARSSSR